ncbi:MAG: right-handed parallel beta-helix repeat-containing protein, partial [Acidobacteria bacterium]|nr:right-handed parallel beta-helix repeat-containing protein [Acidobacteriota bacterium]
AARTVAPVAEKLLVLNGVHNLRFLGLRFEYTAFPLPAQGYAGIQAGHYTAKGDQWNILPAAIELENAVGCQIRNCRILRTGASAIGLRRGCQQNVIEGNEIADTGGSGIQIGEPAGEKQPLPTDPAARVEGNVVRNNHIHHTGQEYFGAIGIWIGFAGSTTVSHNLLHDMPYTGISVGWDWGSRPTPARQNRIEYNHIHHVMQQLSDGGGIYTLGWQPGTVLRGNLIHDTDRLHGRADQNGIFFDQGSKGYLVEDNIIFRTPGGGPLRFNLNEPSWHTFRNNSLGVLPDDPRFPLEKARKAGCNSDGFR